MPPWLSRGRTMRFGIRYVTLALHLRFFIRVNGVRSMLRQRFGLSTFVILFIMVASVSVSFAQNLVSPEVHEDRRVTFRLRAPKAQAAEVSLNGNRLPMVKDDMRSSTRLPDTIPLRNQRIQSCC